ncbi:MAG: response regulator [Verrucomicrobia bacterium]|nr:response regulator [Verrucomicrobiota bacterium]
MAAKPPGLPGKRILLADDQQSLRETINLLLSLGGHTVVEAANGVEALALFKRDHFDLVITDFEMPKMKGNELALKIKEVMPSQPILMITGFAERLGDLGTSVDAILNKPFQFEELQLAMDQLLS